jgi:hypothetical protein
LLLLATSAPARAGELIDARLGASACVDKSVAVSCRATSFADTYDTRTDGFDPGLSVLLYSPTATSGTLRGDAAVAVRFNSLDFGLVDDGSHLRLRWRPEGWAEREGLDFAVFPISSDRLRLGFSRRISWGGDAMFFASGGDDLLGSNGTSVARIPGALARLTKGVFDGFLGAKATTLLDKNVNEQRAVGALLGGFGWEIVHGLRLDANGGFFDRGTNPKQEVLGAPVRTVGGSVQLSYASHDDAPGGANLTFAADDPTSPGRFFQRDSNTGGPAWRLSTEATVISTLLMNPDVAAATISERGYAGDVQLELREDELRVDFTASMRDLPYILVGVPGFVPFVALSPVNVTVRDELLFWAQATYRVPALNLTPGLAVAVQRPATFEGAPPRELAVTGPPPPTAIVMITDAGHADILAPCAAGAGKCGPGLITQAKVFARFDLLEHFAGLVELHVADRNFTVLSITPGARTQVPGFTFGGRIAVAAGF